MKGKWLLGATFMIALTACGSNPAPTAQAATRSPAVNSTEVRPPQPAATIGLPTPVEAPASVIPSATQAVPTKAAPIPTNPSVAAPTAETRTLTASTRPPLTVTSSGPLAATIYVANCRSAPTAEKPGRVVVQISIEASGGNGKYRYYYQDQEWPTKFIDIVGERGTRSIGEVRVNSGDGQEIRKPFDIGIGGLNCP